jgi:type IV secretion system protein VirB4
MATKTALEVLTNEGAIADYLPFSHHVSDTAISTKNGEYMTIIRISGRSHQSASEDEVFRWTRELNNAVRGLASANVCFWSHVVRRKVFEYPDAEFSNVFCKQLDRKYRSSFEDMTLMVNDLYLTVIWRQHSDKVLNFFARREKPTLEQKTIRQENAIKGLEDTVGALSKTLEKYGPETLGIYDHNGHAYSSALEFLAFLVNGEHVPMPVLRDRFGEYMAVNRPIFSQWGEIGEIRTSSRLRRFGMVEIAEYDAQTEPGQLNTLLQSDFEFVLTQSFSALSRPAAKEALVKQRRLLEDAKDVAYQQIGEISEALNSLISGQFVMGEHHATVTVFGDTADQVRAHISSASAMLSDVALVPKTLDLALEAGWWAQFPCNWKFRPRPAPITSLNFLSFSPFHNYMSGKPTGNPWGPAVTILKTVSKTPVYFNFHPSPATEDSTGKSYLGNTILIGKSGTGKTVTLGFMLAQAQKYGPTIVAFDKDRGMEIVLRAMGGRYLPLRIGDPTGFNPFQLEPNSRNLTFLKRLVIRLASGAGEPVTHSDEQQIDQALNTLMFHIDKPFRRMSVLLQSLPNPLSDEGRPTVHARLAKFAEGGEFGWLFDNDDDMLDLTTHRIYGFDVTEFLETPEIRAPLMMYLIYRTEGMLAPEDAAKKPPFIYAFDEFWKMLSDPDFEDLAKNKAKTIRKQNGIFVFATQEPGDALNSPIAKTLVQQTATYIFLPNPGADRDDYIEGFKLTETEFELIRDLGETSRRFLIKQGDSSALAELNLSGFDDELLVLSGTPENADLAERVIAEVGDDPAKWLPVFIERAKAERSK